MPTTYKVRVVTTTAGYESLCKMCDDLGDEALILLKGNDGHRVHPDVIFIDGQRSDDSVIFGWDKLPLTSMFGSKGSLITLLRRLDADRIAWQYAALEAAGGCATVRTESGLVSPELRLDIGIVSVFEREEGGRKLTSVQVV